MAIECFEELSCLRFEVGPPGAGLVKIVKVAKRESNCKSLDTILHGFKEDYIFSYI